MVLGSRIVTEAILLPRIEQVSHSCKVFMVGDVRKNSMVHLKVLRQGESNHNSSRGRNITRLCSCNVHMTESRVSCCGLVPSPVLNTNAFNHLDKQKGAQASAYPVGPLPILIADMLPGQ